MLEARVKDPAAPRCKGSDDRHGRVARRGEPAHREADARDTPPRQIANGMLNDVKSADRVKLIFWDGTGMVLVAKRLEQSAFRWPKIEDGVIRLTPAQFAALLDHAS